MDATDVREVFETILPDNALLSLALESGFQERPRKLDALRFLRAMVIAASTGYGGRQADVMRLYFDSGAERVVRGGFYTWFGPKLEVVMEGIRDRAMTYVDGLKRHLPGWLGRHVRDWVIVDSTTLKLPVELFEKYPGAGDYAAVKIHKRFSVGVGTCIGYHLSPARDHDARHFRIDASWSGLGLLADLGYASLQLLRDCGSHRVHYVIRLKDNWKPKVHQVKIGKIVGSFVKGTDLDVLLDGKVLPLEGEVLDLIVEVGKGPGKVECRLVAIPTPRGYCWYLTNLPGDIRPTQIGDLYRVRWEIESDNKLGKSCLQLDEIGARTVAAVHALIHASMVGATMIGLLAYHHRRKEAPPSQWGRERVVPPIHPQTLARAVGSASVSIATAMELTGEMAERRWIELAAILEHLGRDPNWRCRPSIIDQLRGWTIKPWPATPRKAASALEVVAN